jgi:predicted nucleic acid-binding protein
MRMLLDTSVLVAAHDTKHPQHEPSFELLEEATTAEAGCAAHTLAEVYAVLTRLPVRPRISPDQVMLFLEDVRARLGVVALEEVDYLRALESAARQGIIGGQIYDRLLLECAVRAGAEVIYTWNVRHFQRVAPDLADRIQTP